MKETGLMFKAPLVRAILSDQKTQTRRLAKLPHMNPWGEWEAITVGGPGGGRTSEGKEIPQQPAIGHTRTGDVICAPYLVGDRIYVRETWQEAGGNTGIWYAATDSQADDGNSPVSRWRPAIHMPKALARIWLEITGVRVERLQAISADDAEAEGVGFLRSVPDADETLTAQQLFECLWDSTGGDWAANPWVWVIDFKRIAKP